MELLAVFINSFLIGFSGAMMPGPVLTVGIAETPRYGWKTGPVITIGHAIAEVAVVLLLALGVAAIADHPMIVRTIAVVGGIALLLMAVMMSHDALKGRIVYDTESNVRKADMKLAGKGITTSLSNPYWFVWWATVGLALLVQAQELGWVGPLVFYVGHILSDFVWYTFVTVLVWKGRKLIVGRGMKILILACSLFLLFLGGSFIYNGIMGQV